jgi:hypothetical protein
MIHPAVAKRALRVRAHPLRQDQVGPAVWQRSDTPEGVATVVPGMAPLTEPGR